MSYHIVFAILREGQRMILCYPKTCRLINIELLQVVCIRYYNKLKLVRVCRLNLETLLKYLKRNNW